jgi:3-phenylpropionate/trans-cinnamate dioxygenase ferredoxin reductase subunit
LVVNDVVYAAGAPTMTVGVAQIAKAAGARCFTDAFVSNDVSGATSNISARLVDWLINRPRHVKQERLTVQERSSVSA